MFARERDGNFVIEPTSDRVILDQSNPSSGVYVCKCGKAHSMSRTSEGLVVPEDWEVVSDGHFQSETIITPCCGDEIPVIDDYLFNPFPTMEDGGDG